MDHLLCFTYLGKCEPGMEGEDIGGVGDNKLSIGARIVAEATIARHKHSISNLQNKRCSKYYLA